MSLAGGGWTELTAEVADSVLNIDTNTSREYLYVQNGTVNYYRTPDSTLVWSWSSGQDLYGAYYYSTGSGEQSFEVTPSGEHESYGVAEAAAQRRRTNALSFIHLVWILTMLRLIVSGSARNFWRPCQCGVTVYFRENASLAHTGAPVIVAEPTNQVAFIGSNAQISVTATGSQPLFYQWLFNGTNLTDNAQIAGSQSNVLTLTSVTMGNSGNLPSCRDQRLWLDQRIRHPDCASDSDNCVDKPRPDHLRNGSKPRSVERNSEHPRQLRLQPVDRHSARRGHQHTLRHLHTYRHG